ncbi:MAG TPA: hypothetical protein VHY84_15480 [Bryobacteraceae bacterium]|jgi:hypothetical protein|nr:hypothetical protein [Bryobacteraceae bacterium]
MNRGLQAATGFAIAAATWAAAQPVGLPPLRIAGNMTTIELSPVVVAAN